MIIYPSIKQFRSRPGGAALLNAIEHYKTELGLEDSIIYDSFPLYKDDEGSLVLADALLLSANHGIIVLAICTEHENPSTAEIARCNDIIDQVPSYIHSRLIKNRKLRSTSTQLKFIIEPLIYAPLLQKSITDSLGGAWHSDEHLRSTIKLILGNSTQLNEEDFVELIGTIDGAKGLIRPKARQLTDLPPRSKGKLAEQVEAAITLFDHQQKNGMLGPV